MLLLYLFTSRLFLMGFINASFISANFDDSIQVKNLNDESKNQERNSVVKIFNIFANKYFCKNKTNPTRDTDKESASVLNATESKNHNPNMSQHVCFPCEWPIQIYSAHSSEERYYEKHGNLSEKYEGLQIKNIEDLKDNFQTTDFNHVLVVDLFPFSKFGHPVVIYRIRKMDTNSDSHVEREYITDHGIIEEMEPTNHNRPNMTSADVIEAFLTSHYNFIPLVSTRLRTHQLLRCLTKDYLRLKGYGIIDHLCRLPRYSKPPLKLYEVAPRIKRSSSSSSSKKRFQTKNSSSLSRPSSSSSSSSSLLIDWTRPLYFHPSSGQCHLFTICDHSVVVSGGWNRWSVTDQDERFSREYVRMLGRFGFLGRNVQLFQGFQSTSSLSKGFYNAITKADIRRQITYLCSREHCVNSLVIYLNAPALSNGDMLLGDEDGDGIINVTREMYKMEEFVDDLKDCLAQQVVIIADQTNSDKLIKRLKGQAWHYKGVAGFASGKGFRIPLSNDRRLHFKSSTSSKLSDTNEAKRTKVSKNIFGISDRRFTFTYIWLDVNHTKHCIQDVFQMTIRKSHLGLRPESFLGTLVPRHNIYGAPCDTHRLLSKQELEENYFGCQNLPRRLVEYRAIRARLPDDCKENI